MAKDTNTYIVGGLVLAVAGFLYYNSTKPKEQPQPIIINQAPPTPPTQQTGPTTQQQVSGWLDILDEGLGIYNDWFGGN